MRSSNYKFIPSDTSTYKQGLDKQREIFKEAKHQNNFDSMCDSIENLKSEIKRKAHAKGGKENIRKVEQVVNWYRTLENRYVKNTPEGRQIVFPADIHFKVNKALTIAYEILIYELDKLELL